VEARSTGARGLGERSHRLSPGRRRHETAPGNRLDAQSRANDRRQLSSEAPAAPPAMGSAPSGTSWWMPTWPTIHSVGSGLRAADTMQPHISESSIPSSKGGSSTRAETMSGAGCRNYPDCSRGGFISHGARVQLGRDYPVPFVEHSAARERALGALHYIREQGKVGRA
jgi:hypothetical protein